MVEILRTLLLRHILYPYFMFVSLLPLSHRTNAFVMRRIFSVDSEFEIFLVNGYRIRAK